MKPWKLARIATEASKFAAAALQRWPEHASFFDDSVAGLQQVGWLPPMENFGARLISETRIATMSRLILPAHIKRTNPYWPGDAPGSDEEAQSFCLHFLCAAFLRSLAHSGHLAFGGLALESLGAHRRTLECLLQIEVVVQDKKLAMHCWQAGREAAKKKRDVNPFLKKMKAVSHTIANKQQHADSALTPLQREFRRRVDDSTLHFGPHANIMHATFGRLPDGGFDFFDVGSSDLGMYPLRYAREAVMLAGALVPKLSWIDTKAWRVMFDTLDVRCKELVTLDREKRQISPEHDCPWFSWPKKKRSTAK